jgi:hypothetical protein
LDPLPPEVEELLEPELEPVFDFEFEPDPHAAIPKQSITTVKMIKNFFTVPFPLS